MNFNIYVSLQMSTGEYDMKKSWNLKEIILIIQFYSAMPCEVPKNELGGPSVFFLFLLVEPA